MESIWLPNNAASKRQRLESSSKYKSYIEALLQGGEFDCQTEYYNNSSDNHQKYPQYPLEPNVLFWDLENQVNKQNLILPNCPECGGSLKTLPLINNYRIRQLYGVNEIVLLLSSLLVCNHTKKHQFLGYDPRILTELASFIVVPFKLFHRAGITSEFSDYVFENLCEGAMVRNINATCRKNYEESFATKTNGIGFLSQDFEQIKELLSLKKLCIPSPTIITQSFLARFDEIEDIVQQTVQNIDVPGGFIFVDDSFDIKLSTGSNRSPDRILFALNKDGHVIFWKLVNDKDCLKVNKIFLSYKL